jgi:hypothetical protein
MSLLPFPYSRGVPPCFLDPSAVLRNGYEPVKRKLPVRERNETFRNLGDIVTPLG